MVSIQERREGKRKVIVNKVIANKDENKLSIKGRENVYRLVKMKVRKHGDLKNIKYIKGKYKK